MKRRLLSSLLGSALLCAVSLLPFLAPVAHAQTTYEWTGVCVEGTGVDAVATISGVQCLVGNILSVAVGGIGLAGFVMMIIGAFTYLISGGNAKGVEGGRNTITFAVVGLVVALSAFFILNVIANFTGVNSIMNFRIPNSQPGKTSTF